MAAVFCASFSRRAMVWRRRVIFTRSSRAASSASTGARGIGAGSGAAGAGKGIGFGASERSTSSFITRPSRPLPLDRAGVDALVGHQLLRRGRVLDVALHGRRGGRGRGRSRGLLARGGAGGGGGAAADAAERAAGLHGLALPGVDLGERAAGRRRHLDRDLVGLELAEHLVLGHRVADLLEPGRDRRLGDALAERRHRDLDRLLVGRRRLGVVGRGLAGRPLGRGRRASPPPSSDARLRLGLLVDRREQRVDADGLALLGDDLGEHARGGRRHLDRHLVGLELAEHLVDLHRRRPPS